MITKCNKGGQNALMLCAAAAVMVLVSSCRAPAPEAGRYQWTIASHENGADTIYVIDTDTGEAARWGGNRWILADDQPNSIPDWKAIREERRERVEQMKKQIKKVEKEEEEARVKCEALIKSFSQMPLEKQVAWAKNISIRKIHKGRVPGVPSSITLQMYDDLKGSSRGWTDADKRRWPYKATDDGLVVYFSGTVEGNPLSLGFGLSHTPIDSKEIFPAPATIIDDVKAEIKRQEEKKK